jgi:hypothetical protein
VSLSLERLGYIEDLTNAATDGPWDVESHCHHERGCRCLSCYVCMGWTIDNLQVLLCDETPEAKQVDDACEEVVLRYDDAKFAAEARTFVPELIAEIKRLRQEMETRDA